MGDLVVDEWTFNFQQLGDRHTHTTQGKNENTSSDDDIAEIEYLMQIHCKWSALM